VGSGHKHKGYGLNKECALVTELVLSGRVRAKVMMLKQKGKLLLKGQFTCLIISFEFVNY
jgi:hypothetical protein